MKNGEIKIGVLGLGLIGGSILKALHKLNKYYLVAVSNSSYKKAEKFSDISGNSKELLSGCDIVFVCSKMSGTLDNLNEIENIVSENTIVCDVSSIKNFLKTDFKFDFVMTHPMAGTEFSGFEASCDDLFKGAKWVMMSPNVLVENLIKEMGAIPLLIEASDHDNYAAQISHLPMLISSALFDSVSDDSKIIASSGFRDTTRLSMTNPDLAYDMLQYNKENIIKAYEKFLQSFDKILNMKEDEFSEFMRVSGKKRAQMYDENGKNKL